MYYIYIYGSFHLSHFSYIYYYYNDIFYTSVFSARDALKMASKLKSKNAVFDQPIHHSFAQNF